MSGAFDASKEEKQEQNNHLLLMWKNFHAPPKAQETSNNRAPLADLILVSTSIYPRCIW